MARKHNSIEMWKRRLIAEFSRDKKKAITLGVLLLVAVFFISKMLKSSPPTATAETTPAGAASAGTPSPSGAGNAVWQPVTTKAPRVEAPEGADKGITRDIFMPNPSVFPHAIKTTGAKGVEVVPDEPGRQAAELRRKKELIREQGTELHLESTITGRVPIAIINGTVLGAGGVINGFRIVKIDSQACLVEKEGVRLKLTME